MNMQGSTTMFNVENNGSSLAQSHTFTTQNADGGLNINVDAVINKIKNSTESVA